MEKNEQERLEILCLFCEINPEIVASLSSNIDVRRINTAADFEALIAAENEDPNTDKVCAVLYSQAGDTKHSTLEIAQCLAYKYPGKALLFITKDIANAKDRESIKKNGFDDLFIDPLEVDLLQKKILSILARHKSTGLKLYAPVKLVDLQVGDVFDFDVFFQLSVSKKYIRYIRAGIAVSSEVLEKFRKHSFNFLYIPEESLESFFKMAGAKLGSIDGKAGLSSTEKQHKVETLLRSVTYKFFDDKSAGVSAIGEGREIFKELNSIAENFILKSPKASWFKKMQMTLGGKQDPYSHSSRVGSLGSLFAIALGEGRPELISIAALVHDLGKTLLPSEIASKKEEDLTAVELIKYQLHPELSLRILKERRLIIDEDLTQCILLHHRKWNGSGYSSKAHSVGSLSIETQLLSIADEFDYLISSDTGGPKLSPAKAFDKLREKLEHNPILINRLKTIFCSQQDSP